MKNQNFIFAKTFKNGIKKNRIFSDQMSDRLQNLISTYGDDLILDTNSS